MRRLLFDLPAPEIATLLSEPWQNAEVTIYSNNLMTTDDEYALAYSFTDREGIAQYGYSPPENGTMQLQATDSLATAQGFLAPQSICRGQKSKSEVYNLLTALNSGVQLKAWYNAKTQTLTNDHFKTMHDFTDVGTQAAVTRWVSTKIVSQRYWLRGYGSVLLFADAKYGVPVRDVLPIPFKQFACQMAITDDGVHRVALLYEVNDEVVTPETQLAYLASLAQFDVPVLTYKKVSKKGRAKSTRLDDDYRCLLVQADTNGAWSSARIV